MKRLGLFYLLTSFFMLYFSLQLFSQEEEEISNEEQIKIIETEETQEKEKKEETEKKGDETKTQEFPAILEVTADQLRVRAGIGTNYKELKVLPKGTKVVALKKEFDWIKIMPPKGVPCWVHKDYIKVEGEKGVITGWNVNLRPTPGTEHPVMGQLDKDAEVKVISFDEVRGYYKIEAPNNVETWVSAKYVKFVDAYNEENFKKYFGEEETFVPGDLLKTSDTTKKEEDKTKPEQKDKELLSQLEKKFWEIERERIKEFDKPPESQNYSHLIGAYEKLLENVNNSKIDGTEVLKNKIEHRLNQLRKLQKLLDDYLEALRKRNARLERAEEEFRSQVEGIGLHKKPKEFNAIGYVEPFGVLIKTPPGSHKLVKGGQVLYYLIADSDIDLDKYNGMFVGVIGNEEEPEDDYWKPTKLIRVKAIKVLE